MKRHPDVQAEAASPAKTVVGRPPSLSLRWRVMLLAMSMVAMVVVLMAVAVYAVVSAALYSDIDNRLQSRAQLLIASGSLAADPGKAIEGTRIFGCQRDARESGRSIYTANQQGQTLPVGQPEKSVINGELFMSRRTVANQRVLAVHLPNGSSLLISKSLAPTNAVMTRLKWVLLAVGGIGVVVAAISGGMVARTGLETGGAPHRGDRAVARTDDLRPIPVAAATNWPGSPGLQHDVARVGRIPRAAGAAGRRCRTRAEDP